MRITPEQIMQLIEDQVEHYASAGNRNAIDVLSQLKEEIYGEEQAWALLDSDIENVYSEDDTEADDSTAER